MHYHVSKADRGWAIWRIDQTARVGNVSTRKEAMQIARVLAGWRGKVTVGR